MRTVLGKDAVNMTTRPLQLETNDGVERDLLTLGILMYYHGFHYLVIGVKLLMQDESLLYDVTKGLYSEIAEICSVTPCNVEACIRRVIDRAWCSGLMPNNISQVFDGYITRRPTNSELFSLLLWNVKRREEQ